jgi:pyruvate/2-oxoglutarate dehydrogenase complex dihydrolipoamide acyltransferase (E2) component
MAKEVIMPQLGESVVEGTVTKWLKGEGEQVDEFEALLEVNTDKVDTEIPSPASGVLLKVYVGEGETVGAGTLLAMVGEKGEQVPEAAEAAPARPPTPAEPDKTVPAPAAPAVEAGRSRELGFISPVVARIAAEHDLDLTQIEGTGRGGRITKKDALAYMEKRAAAAPAAAPWESPASGELFRPSEEVYGEKAAPPAPVSAHAPGEVIPHTPVRRSIAEHMLRSVQTSPHVTTVMEADMGRVAAHRAAHKAQFARDGVNLTYTAYFAAAAVEALKTVPVVNASWSDEGVVLHPHVNLGIAVSMGEEGLIVPVIKGAESLSLLALARAVNDLAARARSKELQTGDVQGGTFTITNHGVSGSLFATPIINQPQAAILGVGALQKRVVARELRGPDGSVQDVFAIRPMVYLTLTFDHRMLDGAIGDQFLGTIVQKLEGWA